MPNKRQQHAKVLRAVRKIHRISGITLCFFFLIIALTGILLGWKKNSDGYLLAKTEKGSAKTLAEWLPLDSLYHIADKELHPVLSSSHQIDRIDVRNKKGIVKFICSAHYHGVQVDGKTGEVLSKEVRRADFLENLHDGSLVDKVLGIKNGTFKLFYTSIMGLSLVIFCLSGFWLWYGPKRMQRQARKTK